MHAISSYRGKRPTNKHTNTHANRQDRLQYTVPLSLARSVNIDRYVGVNSSQGIVFCNTNAAFGIISWSAHNNRPWCTKFELCSCIRFTDMKVVPEVRNDDPVPVTIDLLKPKSIGFRGLLLCQVSSHSDQGFFSFSRANTHAFTHRDKVIAISAPPSSSWMMMYLLVMYVYGGGLSGRHSVAKSRRCNIVWERTPALQSAEH